MKERRVSILNEGTPKVLFRVFQSIIGWRKLSSLGTKTSLSYYPGEDWLSISSIA